MSTKPKRWQIITKPELYEELAFPSEIHINVGGKKKSRLLAAAGTPGSSSVASQSTLLTRAEKEQLEMDMLANRDTVASKKKKTKKTKQPLAKRSSTGSIIASLNLSNKHLIYFNNEKVPEAGPDIRLKHKLRLAMHEGQSMDPKRNNLLKSAIQEALSNDIPMAAIKRTIQKLNPIDPSNDFNIYLLQMRYQHKVFLICSVRSENQLELKKKLGEMFRKHIAGFVHAMHMFRSCALVEAIISYQHVGDFSNFDRKVTRDARECQAKGVEIVDFETGAIHFKCNPLELPQMCENLMRKGYRLLHAEYSFRPKSPVILTEDELARYKVFLRKLRKFEEIVDIYDNVEHIERSASATDPISSLDDKTSTAV